MVRKIVSGVMSILLVLSMLSLLSYIQPVRASGTIYIRADGSVDPSTAPIQRDGNIYTFTSNIYDTSIVIERDNIILNGNNLTLQGNDYYNLTYGLYLCDRSNVTIRNMDAIEKFGYGVYLNCSNDCEVSNNIVTVNYRGIYLEKSNQTVIRDNLVAGNVFDAISLDLSNENEVTGNVVPWNGYYSYGRYAYLGLYLNYSNLNIVSNNTITDNQGICMWNSLSNKIQDNIIAQTTHGIVAYFSSNTTITENSIGPTYQHGGYGVYLDSLSNDTLIGNNMTDCNQGIYFIHSSGHLLRGNRLNSNTFSLMFYGETTSNYLNDIDTSNLVNGKPVYYLVDRHYQVINSSTCPEVGFIGLISSTDIQVENITLENDYHGLLIVNTNNSRIVDNTIGTQEGCYLFHSSANEILRNNMTRNGISLALQFCSCRNLISRNIMTGGGVSLGDSDFNIFSDNSVTNSNVGVQLRNSSNNVLSGNMLTDGGCGIVLSSGVSNNTIRNNFISNNTQAGISASDYIYFYDWVSNSTITNNTIIGNKGPPYASGGICLYRVSNSQISNNYIANNYGWGIRLTQYSSYDNISDNVVANNTYDGIQCSNVYYSNLTGNFITNNSDHGVGLYSCLSNRMLENVMASNHYNFGVEPYTSLDNYVDTSNTVDGKPIYYWTHERDKTIPSDAGCVVLVDCANITLKDAILKGNEAGAFLAFTSSSTIQNVTSDNNYYGVKLYGSDHNTIASNAITNNAYAGVSFESSSSNILAENNVEANGGGVGGGALFYGYSNNISSNIIRNNSYYGVVLQERNSFFSGNIIQNNNGYGLYLASSSNLTLSQNSINDNAIDFGVTGTTLAEYSHSIDTSNLIDGRSIRYWVSQADKIVPFDAAYVALVNCTRVTVMGQDVTGNAQGILVAYTNDSRIVDNSVTNNSYGVYLYISHNNVIAGNTAVNNSVSGFYLTSSFKNTLSGNNLVGNCIGIEVYNSLSNRIVDNTMANSTTYGLLLSSSDDNDIYHNNFVGNYESSPWLQAYGGSFVTKWEFDYPYGGNYWSDYTGADHKSGPNQDRPGSDGMGDTPRYIYGSSESQDNYPLMNPCNPATRGICDEKSSVESNLTEYVVAQKAVLNNAEVRGDLNGTINFIDFEIINITTGPFAGKGFSKGTWEATLEGSSYKGDWTGALYVKLGDTQICLEGIVSGEMSGTVEGSLTETVPGSGIYDKYEAVWKIGRFYAATTSANLNLNGTIEYQTLSEFPVTELRVLQEQFAGIVVGDYNCSFATVLTQVSIVSDNPYKGEGFTTLSYTSDLGSGEGWTYNILASAGMVEMKGLLTSPMAGLMSATLDETRLPRTLLVNIERVDLGLPPKTDVKVRTWSPRLASPGQTISYVIELRNDGLLSAENTTLVYLLPFASDFTSASSPGEYDGVIHVVRWDFANIPPRTSKYLSIQVRILWGLSQGSLLTGEVGLFSKEEADAILAHASPSLAEGTKIALEAIWEGITQYFDIPTIPSELTEAMKGAHALGVHLGVTNAFMNNQDYAFEVQALADAVFKGGHDLQVEGWTTTDGKYHFDPPTSWDTVVHTLKLLYAYSPITDSDKRPTTVIAVARDPNEKHGQQGYVSAGQTLNYSIGYENEGEGSAFGVYITDSLDQNLNASTLIIGENGTYDSLTRTITWLVGEVVSHGNGTVTYSVNVTSDALIGNEIVNFATVYFPSVPETTRTNGVVNMISYPHDVATQDISPTKAVVGENYPLTINVTVKNDGSNAETFNVTAYANVTSISSQTVALLSGDSTTLTLTWNTTGFAYGKYTISAYAQLVSGETNTVNNNLTGGLVTVTIPGDINGDFKVSLADLVILANSYGSKPGDTKWNPNADINGNGIVDLADLVLMATHYGQHYP